MVRLVDLAAAFACVGLVDGQWTGFKSCDVLIDAGLGDKLLLASGPGDGYSRSLGSYYSLTIREITPWCILQPENAQDVSAAIKALSPLTGAGQWNIAIRGGGHSHWNNNNIAQASFHSGRRGFACDDVVNYEVVLADGSIVNANKRVNPRLFKALKGGSSNFGIVTRFDMAAFPAGDLHGGIFLTTWDQKDKILDGFVDVIATNKNHPADSQIVLFQHQTGLPQPMVGTIAVNPDGNASAPVFDALRGMPSVIDLRQTQTYGELVSSMIDDGGQSVIPEEDLTIILIFQPLPKHYGQANAGGNVLGLDKTLTEDSIIWLGEAFINTHAVEALFQSKLAVVGAQLEAYAVSIGANTQWRYLKYVNPTQDPLKSYGPENVAFIKKVAQEYDPSGFFQTRVSGGFKISNVE
ncbi:putative FAD-linked oxidoreductase like protein [Verticillium longisporum]|nr:putative FAD-linked oxidoreductase like protein [Verticillium longisporum]